jgi:TPR repeat protein
VFLGGTRKTLEEIKAKAENGDPKAQYNLGACYRDGQGAGKSHADTFKWFCIAGYQRA